MQNWPYFGFKENMVAFSAQKRDSLYSCASNSGKLEADVTCPTTSLQTFEEEFLSVSCH